MKAVRPKGDPDQIKIVGVDQQGVYPLKIRVEPHELWKITCTSCWLPSSEELEILNNGGAIEVTICGGQPPLLVETVLRDDPLLPG